MNNGVSRREALAVAAGAVTAAAGTARAMPTDSLDAIARGRGLRFGSAVSWGRPAADRGSFANPAYARLLERDCGLLVAENEMKWKALRPSGPPRAILVILATGKRTSCVNAPSAA